MNKNFILFLILILFFNLILLTLKLNKKDEINIKPNKPSINKYEKIEEKENLDIIGLNVNDINFDIMSGKKSFIQMANELLNIAEKEGNASIEIYGKSSKNSKLTAIHIGDPKLPSVLITGCIHGNEVHAMSIVGSIMKTIIKNKKQKHIEALLEKRHLTFIPVVSPDSFPRYRAVDRVDPNRNFPTLRNPNKISVPPIENLKKLFLKYKYESVVSGHTWGRVFLIPFGDTYEKNQYHEDYLKLFGNITKSPYNFKASNENQCNVTQYGFNPDPEGKTMSALSGYGVMRTCNIYKKLVVGSEVDWFYRNGAISTVAEFGEHQKIPTNQETLEETKRVFKAILLFIEKAPEIKKNHRFPGELEGSPVAPEINNNNNNNYPKSKICSNCDGSGTEPFGMNKGETCKTCWGSGSE